MKPSLELKIGQQLTITPQLQQAIKLLQLSTVDLRTEILSAIETNPLLEIKEDVFSEEDSLEALEENKNEEEDLASFDQQDWGKPKHSSELSPIETLNGSPLSLRDHLFWQMQLTPFSEKDKLIAAAIIDSINEDGFLECSLNDIIATLQPNIEASLPEIEAILHRIQQFDPLGVGSRNIEECLKVQLNHLPTSTPWHHQAQLLITHYLLLLSKHDYISLRRRLGLTINELQEVISLIKTLNPRPGAAINERTPEFIIPDVIIYKKFDQWKVKLNLEWVPILQINDNYAKIDCFKQQLQEAKWFLKSIETRNETLLNVANCILKHQIDFFEKGPEYMKPLVLQDIADDLEMHESTVSRITTQKYLHSPHGMFELKYFFSSHISKTSGDDASSIAVRALIKKIISKENPKKPLSDNMLTKILAEKGLIIARRTIAKYREEMNILPSNERKQLL